MALARVPQVRGFGGDRLSGRVGLCCLDGVKVCGLGSKGPHRAGFYSFMVRGLRFLVYGYFGFSGLGAWMLNE